MKPIERIWRPTLEDLDGLEYPYFERLLGLVSRWPDFPLSNEYWVSGSKELEASAYRMLFAFQSLIRRRDVVGLTLMAVSSSSRGNSRCLRMR